MSMTKRMGWLDADLPFQILAVNAPFPVPIWKATGFIEAYSWYFRDTSRDIMIVHPSTTAQRIATLIAQEIPAQQPLAIFGFSQGGYLAPFLGKLLPNLKSIVAVGSGYPPEPYSEVDKRVHVHAIHGMADDRWPFEASKATHTKLIESGFKGEFHAIPDLDHRVDPMLSPLVQRLVLESLK